MPPTIAADPARGAYDVLAPYYDVLTAGYEYERWLGQIEALALGLGLGGRRVLDLGCGTGKSFMPLLRRGYEIAACDISPAMVERARKRAGRGVDVFVADMRQLPALEPVDLVTCLDDAVNYLLSESELTAAFEGVAANLAEGGIFVFDVNSLATFRTAFAEEDVVSSGDTVFCLRGEGDPQAPPGSLATSVIEILPGGGEGTAPTVSRHLQRHHPPALLRRCLRDAGLDPVAVFGQLPGARLERPPDESRHTKLLFFARKLAKRSLDHRSQEVTKRVHPHLS
jgi:SAM-dependent methyltransferase